MKEPIERIAGGAHSPGQRGATAVEYGMLVALISGVIIVIVGTVGGQLSTGLTNFVNSW